MNESNDRRWSSAKMIGFRFLLAYLFLFYFPFPSGLVNPQWLGGHFEGLWAKVVPWMAQALNIDVPDLNNGGSGDSTYEHIKLLCIVLGAVLITVVWSLLDRRRGDYRALSAWSRIWVRYALAVCMLTYGASKVLMVQFEPPGYGRLIQPVGQMSPMALLWTFMGSSALYTTFTGLAEVFGGILLFFRRTTTLGALVVAAIMTNVVMLNMAYDVPVKLGSIHVLLLALVLLAPQAGRLIDFFIRNRATEPTDLGPIFANKTVRQIGVAVKLALVGIYLAFLTWDTQKQYFEHIASREKEPVAPEGNYLVESFKRDNRDFQKPTVDPDTYGWKTFSLRKGIVGVRTEDGTLRRFKADGDPKLGPFNLIPVDDKMLPLPGAASAGTLSLKLTEEGRAVVAGTFNGHPVEAALERQNASDMPLFSRGFHWINEKPYFHFFSTDKSR